MPPYIAPVPMNAPITFIPPRPPIAQLTRLRPLPPNSTTLLADIKTLTTLLHQLRNHAASLRLRLSPLLTNPTTLKSVENKDLKTLYRQLYRPLIDLFKQHAHTFPTMDIRRDHLSNTLNCFTALANPERTAHLPGYTAADYFRLAEQWRHKLEQSIERLVANEFPWFLQDVFRAYGMYVSNDRQLFSLPVPEKVLDISDLEAIGCGPANEEERKVMLDEFAKEAKGDATTMEGKARYLLALLDKLSCFVKADGGEAGREWMTGKQRGYWKGYETTTEEGMKGAVERFWWRYRGMLERKYGPLTGQGCPGSLREVVSMSDVVEEKERERELEREIERVITRRGFPPGLPFPEGMGFEFMDGEKGVYQITFDEEGEMESVVVKPEAGV